MSVDVRNGKRLARRGRRRRRKAIQLGVEQLEPRQMLAVNVLTWHNDLTRQGLNSAETALTPVNVNSSNFRQTVYLRRRPAGGRRRPDLRRAAVRLEPCDPRPRHSQRRLRRHRK